MPSTRTDILDGLAQSNHGLQRLAEAHRYMQVGMSVSSVTHDLNNHLGAVMAYAELLGMEHTDSETAHMVEEIVEAVKRSSRLIEDITAIARKERLDLTRVQTTEIARRALEIRKYELTMGGIQLEERVEEDVCLLTCDRPKVEHCLLYLISNALEAVEDREKPRVRFTLMHEDSGVCFEVWDSGPGIPESLREKCFEPLVTTKGPPHLGLGLFAARRIAVLHEGTLTYDPERGMRLCLPQHSEGWTPRV